MRQSKMNRMRSDGNNELRVWERKESVRGRKISLARTLVKCGCCSEKVEIYHDKDSLEINGVEGSIQNWREILLPLLDQ